ncbi:MAG: hypothetical protein ABI895_27520 [Deltaproteobacteria bacterium]
MATVSAQGAERTDSAEADVAVDLSPVAAPENLVLLATLRSPARSVDTLMSWSGLGLDWRALLQAGPAAQFLPVIDLDAPLDAAAVLDPKSKNKPKLWFAASIGLTSRQGALDAFRAMDAPVDVVEPGVYSVRPNPKTLCFIASSLGKAKVRLVCGEDREALELLSPYLTRGNPSENTGDAALHVEVRAEPAWRLYGDKAQFLKLSIPMLLGEVSIGNAEFDAALRETASAAVEELTVTLADLKGVRLDARLRDAPAELSLVLGMDLRGSKSWLAGALAGAETRASVAPDSFWKLPLDAREASYQARSSPDSLQKALELLERVAQTGLNQLGASPAVQKDWPQALQAALSLPGPIVSARGEVPARLVAATPDEREQLRADAGYLILGAEDEGNRYGALLERTLRLYEDSALRKGLAQRYGLSVANLPKVQSRKGPARLPESHVYTVDVPVAAFTSLAGAKVKGPAKAASGTVPISILIGREGQRTWIAASSYPSLNEELLAGIVAVNGPEATLARRAGLEALRQEKANLAGFWTLSGIANSWRRPELKKLLASLGPSDVPMIGRATGHAAGPSGEAELHVPAQVFRDMAAQLQPKR